MTFRRATSALALGLVALLAAGCQGATPSAPTGDIVGSAAWAAEERLVYYLRTVEGDLVGHGTLETHLDGDRLVLVQQYTEAGTPAGGTPATDTTIVTVDATTFAAVSGERVIVRRASDDSMSEERYDWTYEVDAEGDLRLASIRTQGGDTDEGSVRLRDYAFDNESSLWLWRTLAFEEGFNRNYVSVNPMDRSQQTVNLQVPQRETVTVPAGEFEAWRLIFRSGRAVRTAWISVDAPHVVLRWDNGDLVFELVRATSSVE
ncbi:MAG: DUF3108 domain-containing protein [Chloroflexi bacterium]|nr:DUF3108 domain-containing protein [Chloroflexota bacterium]MDA1239772.1 DUF3108 domain-containing protein [Chloroflexota bacterium]